MEPLVAQAVSDTLCSRVSEGGDDISGEFVVYRYQANRAYSDQMLALTQFTNHTSLRLIDPSPGDPGNSDPGAFQSQRGRLASLAACASGMCLRGALLDLRIADGELENSPGAAALDLRKDTSLGVPVNEWLLGTTAERLGWVFDRYAALHDPLFSARLAELILRRQEERGTAFTTLGDLGVVVEELRHDFDAEHAAQGPSTQGLQTQVLRALRVFINDDPEQLEQALHGCFGRLRTGGTVIVASYSPWERSVVRRVLHALEAPSARVLDGAVPSDSLAVLYPWTALRQSWAVERASALVKPGPHPVSIVAVHVLRKVSHRMERTEQVPGGKGGGTCSSSSSSSAAVGLQPSFERPSATEIDANPPSHPTAIRTADAPGAPQPGALRIDPSAAAPLDSFPKLVGTSSSAAPAAAPAADVDLHGAAQLAELSQIREEIDSRKAVLAATGSSVTAQKKDATLRELFRRQDRLYALKRQAWIYERGVQRAHIPVLLHEAVEHLMALGPDGVYVDCTFGRGGHSRRILELLSERGFLEAFDIDPMAVVCQLILNPSPVGCASPHPSPNLHFWLP